MSGKHAPASPASFVLSVARAVAGALAVLGIIVGFAVVAVGSRTSNPPGPGTSPSIVGSASPSPSATPLATPDGATTPTAEPVSDPSLRPKSAVIVAVLNGTQRNGVARALSDKLRAGGYSVRPPGNGPATEATTIYYRSGSKADAEALRRAFMNYLSARRVVRAPAGGPAVSSATVTVVIGSDYPAL